MNELLDTTLDACGCCEPEPAQAPIYNRPGLPALSYRVGVYGSFLLRMLDRVGTYTLQDGDFAGTRPLAALTTRALDDPAIALLDASAVMADVLTFYQERIANEGFLRTATERRSILELARAIGYELSPGVAATAYLAFTVEDAQGAPGVAFVPAGTKVQSIPPQGKLPQSFETAEAFTAYKEWNALRPRLSQPQNIITTIKKVYLDGMASRLKPGDRLLIDAGGMQRLAQVLSINEQAEQKRTEVMLDGSTDPIFSSSALPNGTVDINTRIALDESTIDTYIRGKQWTDDELNAFLTFNQWDQKELLTFLESEHDANASGSIYALRLKMSVFGHNAPLYSSLPNINNAAYPGQPWDDPYLPIWKYQQSGSYYQQADLYLERVVDGLVADTWVVIDAVGASPRIYKLASFIEYSLAEFAMSGKASGLTLQTLAGAPLDDNTTDKPDGFTIRTTTIYLQSEELALAEIPLGDGLEEDPNILTLNGLVLGLRKGQVVVLTGERIDMPGVTTSELLVISDVNHLGGFTELTFETGRQYGYKRSTLSINANVARATHGETVNEILGSGSGALANQQFTLRKPPLTHIPAATPSGSASTLQLRVNNLLWSQAPSLYGLGSNDEGYIIRIGDDSKATVILGDGKKGARLPTGENNITAVYRSGIGLGGEVDAGSLTLLPIRPLGVRSVVNPLAASGAADPEKMADARSNAPLTVRTLDRIVSLQDYEDFASAFAGIGKAQAIDLWSGEHHLVHLTIAGADESPIEGGNFRDNFIAALDNARDPAQLVRVDTFDQLLFNLSANVAVDSRYIKEDVFQAISDALVDAFSFPKRRFGQVVTAAEVITVIQDVKGVMYVDLDLLYLSSGVQAPNQILPAGIAHVAGGAIQQAQLLLINTLGITLQEVSA